MNHHHGNNRYSFRWTRDAETVTPNKTSLFLMCLSELLVTVTESCMETVLPKCSQSERMTKELEKVSLALNLIKLR